METLLAYTAVAGVVLGGIGRGIGKKNLVSAGISICTFSILILVLSSLV